MDSEGVPEEAGFRGDVVMMKNHATTTEMNAEKGGGKGSGEEEAERTAEEAAVGVVTVIVSTLMLKMIKTFQLWVLSVLEA